MKSRRKFAVGVVAFLASAAAGLFGWNYTHPSTLISGPMVQMPAPDRISIVWEMYAGFFSQPRLLVRFPDGHAEDFAAERIGERCVASFPCSAGLPYEYELTIQGSLSGTRTIAGPFTTRAPAPPGTPFRFVAFGDSGSGNNSQSLIADLIAAAKPDVVIHVGDLIYPAGASEDYLRKFFDPNAGFIASAPFMPALGNHDCATFRGRPFLANFILPENGPAGIEPERCYWFDYGDARFVALDSNKADSAYGVMTPALFQDAVAPWMRKVFNESKVRWKFAYWHHPWYTNSSHDPKEAAALKAAIAPVVEETGVDIIFCGHNHLYERTAPMKADQIVPDGQGVVYITTGAGGASRYPARDEPRPYIRVSHDQTYSFTRVDVSPTRVELVQIDENGKTIDAFVLEKP